MRRLALALASLLFLLGCSEDVKAPPVPSSTPTSVQTPIRSYTTGVIFTVDANQLCPVTTKRVSLTERQERIVLRRYHLPPDTEVAEWDHLIALGAGGGNGVHNIWPQLSVQDKKRKDALEAKLHADICHGRITVTEAQYQEMNFWRYW